MQGEWQRKRILIWGKTRPEISKTYREIVRTGGIFQDTKRFVRLYPIPLRYMEDERIFKKYQWIDAYIMKSQHDYRPESYKIRFDDIQPLDVIPSKSGNWDARAQWVMQPHNIFQSVEALQEQQKKDLTSLGLVQPREIIDIRSERRSEQELKEFQERYEQATQQMELPLDPDTGREIRPLRAADFRFRITFRCNDERCVKPHNFSVLDWETDALYFNLRERGESPIEAAAKVIDKLQNQVCAPDKDLHFYLGNLFSHQQIFSIGGIWWPKRKPNEQQLTLF